MHMHPEAIWHVVLISFRPNTTDAERQAVFARYQTLAQCCGGGSAGILFFRVEWNLDTRKSVHLVEIAVFESNEALQRFRAHPQHNAITDTLRSIADWKVGDFRHPYPAGQVLPENE